MFSLKSISPDALALISALLGVTLADDLDTDDLNSLGNSIIVIGQVILTIAAQTVNMESQCKKDPIAQQLDSIQRQVQALQEQLGCSNNSNNNSSCSRRRRY